MRVQLPPNSRIKCPLRCFHRQIDILRRCGCKTGNGLLGAGVDSLEGTFRTTGLVLTIDEYLVLDLLKSLLISVHVYLMFSFGMDQLEEYHSVFHL